MAHGDDWSGSPEIAVAAQRGCTELDWGLGCFVLYFVYLIICYFDLLCRLKPDICFNLHWSCVILFCVICNYISLDYFHCFRLN